MTETNNKSLLCNDVIFKSLFLENTNILSMFIKDITGYDLGSITLLCNEMPIVRKNEKFKS